MVSLIQRLQRSVIATQLLKYAVAGLVSNAIGYAAYLLLTMAFSVTPKVAMTCLYFVSATLGFIANRHSTFAFSGEIFSAVIRFVFAHACGYAVNMLILVVFVDHLGFPHQVMQAIAVVIVAAFLFMAFKLFVFPQARTSTTKFTP